MSERRELPRCAAHGLAYDPAVSAGCVLCRNSKPPVARSSLPPGAPSSGLGGALPPYAPNTASSEATGVGGWTIARLILIFLCVALQTVLSKVETPRMMMSYHLGMGLGGSIVAALFCLPIARFRNLGSFSKLALVFTLLGTVSTLSAVARKISTSAEPWAGTGTLVDRKAPIGNLMLRVPESWRFESRSNESGLPISMLQAPDGSAFVWTTEKGSDFAAGFSMSEYAAVMRTVYEERLATNIGPGQPVTLSGTPAMRFAFEGTREHVRVKGYLYVAKGRSDFCHLLAFALPSKFEHLEQTMAGVIENAVID